MSLVRSPHGLVGCNRKPASQLLTPLARLPACLMQPVARVRMPRRVPYGFHGLWISEAQLQAQAKSDAGARAVTAGVGALGGISPNSAVGTLGTAAE
jgi:hypothetical protein